ncbi:DEAD/DEAH box helicase [Nocardia transvalensis]|uniref:DEAD/DEAH box helicase n=1 Tax=Nocardia transvalensis TaxID=37333 RepID=UPI00189313DD|nr:DEAD/DEAH box helicase [Nocardia transvalensis]MBF6333518.1 DEAD/DEAH box helicase family protein [Nocardia transvalensis]
MTGTTTHPQPRPHQREALAALDTEYRTGADRAQIRMAPGTGKTLIGPWLARRLSARTVVIFTSSIALVAQTITQWRRSGLPMHTLAVCSDPTTNSGRDEIGVDGIDPYRGVHDSTGVTTHADVVTRFLRRDTPGDTLTVLVSTYHSAAVIRDALHYLDAPLDLLIADEAHHLAGRVDERFQPVLDTDAIPARRRLFQTATPVVLGNLATADPLDELTGAVDRLYSMDDPRTFGRIAYEIPVGEAVAQRLLTPYRVVVGTHRITRRNGPTQAALAVLDDTVSRYGIRRILTFHNRVAGARRFAERINRLGEIAGIRAEAYAVDGSMPDRQRRDILDTLTDPARAGMITLVASAQCLREGVDVPAVDAVLFADPRSSVTSIMQAIGRVLRPHPDKDVGTIIVPVVLDDTDDDLDQLADSPYSHVWRVLRGLRTHDARIALDLDRARATSSPGTVDPGQLPWLTVVGGEEPGRVVARLLERTSAIWEMYFGLLTTAAQQHGSASAVTATTVVDGKRLGMWVVGQRVRYSQGLLGYDRIRRLETVPGWRWAAAAAADERTLTVLDQVVARHGTLTENPCGDSIYTGLRDGLNRPLGLWVATQIFKYRDGELDPTLQIELEKRPGWTWNPLSADDDAGVEALRKFVAWEGHTNVPDDHVEDGFPLGAWLGRVRRRKVFGVLPPAVETMLFAAIPPDTSAKRERRFSWKSSETWWGIGIQAARQFTTRTGSLDELPVDHVEVVDDYPFHLYHWVNRVRLGRRKGELDPERAEEVEALPGWQWRGERHQRECGEPIDLGKIPHGRRGYYAGCSCAICLREARAYARAHARTRREVYRTDWVDAFDVAAHLQQLLAQDPTTDRSDRLFTVGAIAAAAGVSTGVVQGLVKGRMTKCHPVHRRVLLELTVEDVLAVRSVPRSRGRWGIAGQGIKVDPAPTWALVDDLFAHGWTTAAITAGMGYARTSSLPFDRDSVSASHAKMMRLFYDSLHGDLTPPPQPPHRSRRPGARPVNKFDSQAEQFARDLLLQGYQVPHVARRTGLSQPLVSAIESTLRQAEGRRAA